jgi:UDP-N-acetyl-2-amino-2-deoxyglucuronate dehydrogenase
LSPATSPDEKAAANIAPMKTYNVGVIGHGWVASAHIPALNGTRQAQVTAIYTRRDLDPAEASARYGGNIKVYRDLDAMLADTTIHAVSICSFPKDHAKQFVAAVKAGKHIIIEKPLALSLKDLEAMAAALKGTKIKTCVCFEVRYSGQFQSIQGVLDAGLIGDVHFAEVDYFHGVGPWYGQFRWSHLKAEAGGSLLSAGCHALDALLMVMKGEPAEVSAYATSGKSEHFAPYDFPTTQISIVKFKDGRVGKTTSCLDCLQPYYFHTHIVGSHGSILDNKFHSTKLGMLDKHKWSQLSFAPVDSGDVKDHPYLTQFQAFFDALDARAEMPLTSFWDAYKTHRVIFAADKSAATGRPAKV